jgi:molybdopterin-guanine dinucleotide biosynthesis protein A
VRSVAGLVLTGGESRRFGVDKAVLLVDGERLVDRAMRVLGMVGKPVLEVGPGFTGPTAVREEPPGGGPLVAMAAGGAAMRAGNPSSRAVIVLAVDLPRIDRSTLAWLVGHPANDCVVPVVDGQPQSLCARYTIDALTVAGELVDRGERSVRALLDSIAVHYADESEWGAVIDAQTFIDVDTRDDAAALGIEMPKSPK